jgi:hypothetical protein
LQKFVTGGKAVLLDGEVSHANKLTARITPLFAPRQVILAPLLVALMTAADKAWGKEHKAFMMEHFPTGAAVTVDHVPCPHSKKDFLAAADKLKEDHKAQAGVLIADASPTWTKMADALKRVEITRKDRNNRIKDKASEAVAARQQLELEPKEDTLASVAAFQLACKDEQEKEEEDLEQLIEDEAVAQTELVARLKEEARVVSEAVMEMRQAAKADIKAEKKALAEQAKTKKRKADDAQATGNAQPRFCSNPLCSMEGTVGTMFPCDKSKGHGPKGFYFCKKAACTKMLKGHNNVCKF